MKLNRLLWGEQWFQTDEQVGRAKIEKIPHLKPVFAKNGTITAANSSSISDGAAALVLASEESAQRNSMPCLARVVGQVAVAKHPKDFTTAPILAAQKLLGRLKWSVDAVDLWEVNEAFAVVCLAFIRDIGVSPDRLNVKGGACAIGHPIGASGARILVSLLHAMVERGRIQRRGGRLYRRRGSHSDRLRKAIKPGSLAPAKVNPEPLFWMQVHHFF